MRTLVGSALALMVGISSAWAEPVERDVAWLAASIDAPPEDPGRECLESAVATLTGVGDLRLGRVSDDEMRSALVDGVTDPDLLAMRRAEGEVWVKTHAPASVAAEHLDRCLALDGVMLKGSPAVEACLEPMTPAVARQVDDAEIHEQARRLATCLAGRANAARAPAKGPCVVLLGGGGTLTGNAEVDGNWFKLAGAVSNAVATELAAKSYDVRPLIIDEQDGQRRFDALWSELGATHCATTVQVSYRLRSTDGSGQVDAFSFQADVLRFNSRDDRTETAVSDYTKTYDFALTSEVMQKLSLSALGVKMADDIVAAHVLPTQ